MTADIGALPAPLTPPECDLHGLEYMPLYGVHLFGSEFYAQASAEEFRAGVKLLWVAWTQVPAGSLPDDDVALCLFADMGRDVSGWRAMRGRALAGWVRCNDGRLYHPFLCKQAMVALSTREAWRKRQQNHRAKKGGTKAADVTGDTTVTTPGHHRNVTHEGKGRERSSYGTTVPSLPAQELGASRAGTPGLDVPPSRQTVAGQPEQPTAKQPLSRGDVLRPVATDGLWRRSFEGIQAKAAELGLPPYDRDAAQRGKGLSQFNYKQMVLKAHEDRYRLKLVGGGV